jgi:hypothetical protein
MTLVKKAPNIERMKEIVLSPKKYLRHCTGGADGTNAYMILTDHDSQLRRFGEIMLGKSGHLRFWKDDDKVYVLDTVNQEYVVLSVDQKIAGFFASEDDDTTLGECLYREDVLYISDPHKYPTYQFYLLRS